MAAARANEVDIRISTSASRNFVRMAWRKTGGQPIFRVVSLANSEVVLTIPSLEAATSYEIRAYLMTRQSFDLYRGGNSGSTGTLIPEITPASMWLSNLSSGGLGKSQVVTATTGNPPPPPPPPPDLDDDDNPPHMDDDDDGVRDDDDNGVDDDDSPPPPPVQDNDDDDDGGSDDDEDDGDGDGDDDEDD